MNNSDTQAKTLKVIILSQLLIEANDDIKDTNMYKGKLKVFGKQYINQLGRAIKQTDAVYNAQPEMYHNVLKNIEELCEKLAQCDVHDMVMINQIHQHYSNHREDWESFFKVELEELNS
jgi:hypothetical protein|tara:strand:+ start:30506 stop:30862 length:357 start_codon:yes stop_codon:yes gene_type:complete